MKELPLKLCPQCRKYSDLSVIKCSCGADLSEVPAILGSGVSADRINEINENLPVYVQLCPSCGTLNFCSDPARPAQKCYNCGRNKISGMKPRPYVPEAGNSTGAAGEGKGPAPAAAAAPEQSAGKGRGSSGIYAPMSEQADKWLNILKERAAKSGEKITPEILDSHSKSPEPQSENQHIQSQARHWDDEAQQRRWDDEPQSDPCMVLSATGYGGGSFEICASGCPVTLGRNESFGDFLSQDHRVSGTHCRISYSGGSWYVEDLNSRNGTFLNDRDLGLNGHSVLKQGDMLKLGHKADSMCFYLSFR